MKIVADENMAHGIVARLRASGHEVIFIAEIAQGNADIDVLALALQEQAIVLTDDKDFGDLVMFQKRPSWGVILAHLDGISVSDRAEMILSLLNDHAQELFGAFTVISGHNIRIRRLPS